MTETSFDPSNIDNYHYTPVGVSPRTLYGKKADGKIYHVSKVARGGNCGCTCPDCGAILIAKQGKEKIWHFSHASDGTNCASPGETALHLNAKKIIEDNGGLYICGFETYARYSSVSFSSVELEKYQDGIRPDLIGHGPSDGFGDYMVIEVMVTHAVGEDKRKVLADRGAPAIEIDLSRISRSLTWAELKHQILYAAPRRWLHHPEVERLKKLREERSAAAEALRRQDAERRRREQAASQRAREKREAQESEAIETLHAAYRRPPSQLEVPTGTRAEIENWASIGIDLSWGADDPSPFDVPSAVWRAHLFKEQAPWYSREDDLRAEDSFRLILEEARGIVKPEFGEGQAHAFPQTRGMSPMTVAYNAYLKLPHRSTLEERWRSVEDMRGSLLKLDELFTEMDMTLLLNGAPVGRAMTHSIAGLTSMNGGSSAPLAIRRAIATLDQEFLNLPSESDLETMTRAGLAFRDASGGQYGLIYLAKVLAPALHHNRQAALASALREVEDARSSVHAYIKGKGQGDLLNSFLASPCRVLLDKGRINASLQQVIDTRSADMATSLGNVVKDHVKKLQDIQRYFMRGEEIAALTGSSQAGHVVLRAFMEALPEDGVTKGFDAALRRHSDTAEIVETLIVRINSSREKYGEDFMERCIISSYPNTDVTVTMAQAFATGDRVAISCFKQNLFVSMSAPSWVEKLTVEE